MSTPDYSKIENFNIAAIDAVRDNFKGESIEDDIVSVVYKYKGRTLKVTAEISLDGERLRYVGVQNVELVKGEQNTI